MPNPADLPGFYFDPEKNRYFPVKGPIPGVSKRSSLPNHRKEPLQTCHVDNPHGRKRRKVSELLQVRELHGRFVTLNDRRNNFEQEYQKLQASHPMAWKYQKTDCIADSSLEQFHVIIQTRDGQKETNLLAMGSMNGTLSLYEIGKVGQQFDYGFNCLPKPVWPLSSEYNTGCSTRSIWSSTEASECFSSSISCITRVGNNSSFDSADDSSSFQNGLVTTLGSGESGGSIYILNLTEPLDFCSDASDFHRVAMKIVSFGCTIWTAACNSNGTDATIGTNLGAAVINLETGGLSWVYRTKSDILSQQLDQSGKVVLCGLRDGSIVAVDIRQRPLGSLSSFPPGHQIPSTPRIHRRDKKLNKQRLELKGHSSQSNVVYMPLAVCSLVSLRSDDQYFLGSSMDGTIKLFDLRLLQRGGVQSYEGHVNSHTRLQLGVDPSETLVMSGGEDCCVRIWSIKTSELLFGDEISNSVVQTICCPQIRNVPYGTRGTRCYDENPYEMEHCWGAWLGSREGLFYMHGT